MGFFYVLVYTAVIDIVYKKKKKKLLEKGNNSKIKKKKRVLNFDLTHKIDLLKMKF